MTYSVVYLRRSVAFDDMRVEYLRHRACLQQAQSSRLLVPCTRLISSALDSRATDHQLGTADALAIANNACQSVRHQGPDLQNILRFIVRLS